jgi:hypothetical protein
MNYIDNNIKIKNPELQSLYLEPILLYSIGGIQFTCLLEIIQKKLSLSISYKKIKKYLYHLINYELVIYDGQRKIYTTNTEGINLLFSIYKEKKLNKINSEDLLITLE